MMNKIACYTCVTGSYDHVNDPSYVTPCIDYICFTDNKEFKSRIWKTRPIPDDLLGLSLIKQQRVIKICPHRYLPEYDITIWIDGNVNIFGNLNMLLATHNLDITPLYTRPHPSRRCIYDEAKAILSLKKENKEMIDKILARYKEEKMPKNIGMAETNVILRKKTDKCIQICNAWVEELLLNSHRDQLSFNYICWKNHFLPGYMLELFNMNNNQFFNLSSHLKKVKY